MVQKRKITKKTKTVKRKKIKETKKEEKKVEKKLKKEEKRKYIEGIGRRKTSTARVRIFELKNSKSEEEKITINNKDYKIYFPIKEYQKIITSPLKRVKIKKPIEISVLVKGGGTTGQAEAIRLGLSRALVKLDQKFYEPLKRADLLTRDPRMKERKKFGLKRARRAPQWQKR